MNNNQSTINTENFQSLIDNYESAIKEITNEIDEYQIEQSHIRSQTSLLIDENLQLATQISAFLSQKNSSNQENESEFKETDYLNNLKDQLRTVVDEKDNVVKLWQNAAETVEFLEDQLKFYQDSNQGLVPKEELLKIKSSYEERINILEDTLLKLQQSTSTAVIPRTVDCNTESKHVEDVKSIKIIENLEDEVLKLQERLKQTEKSKSLIEKSAENKTREINKVKLKNKECVLKVEEALKIIEAALNEKDGALLRENEANAKIQYLTKSLDEVIASSNEKLKTHAEGIKLEYEMKLKQITDDLHNALEDLKLKSEKFEELSNERAVMKHEIDRLKRGKFDFDDTAASKMLILEKNLENTFQKLLLSEKQNIQLRSENESIKNDQDQMASYYERDVKSREAEKILLKKNITRLQFELNECKNQIQKQLEFIGELNDKIDENEGKYSEHLQDINKCHIDKIEEIVKTHESNTREIENQLISQMDINKKWRDETKSIIESLEKRLLNLKADQTKLKSDNKSLSDKLRDANSKIYEYKKLLQVISKDVNKITSMALPEIKETTAR